MFLLFEFNDIILLVYTFTLYMDVNYLPVYTNTVIMFHMPPPSRVAAPDLKNMGEFERRLFLAKQKGRDPMPSVMDIP